MTRDEFKAHLREKNLKVLAYVKRKKLKKLICVLAGNAILIALALFTVKEMAKPELAMPTYLSVALVCILFSWSAKPKGLLFAKIYVGEIEKAFLDNRLKVGDGYGRMGRRPISVNLWVLTVKDEQGKEYEIELLPKYASCYLVGDRIAMVPAIEYPFLIDPPKDRETVCWWCGSINPPSIRECRNCNRIYVD